MANRGDDAELDALDERALRTLVRATFDVTGVELFHQAARHLAELLGAKAALVGELVGSDRIRSLAFWLDGAPARPIDYPLAGTPCSEVVSAGICWVPDRARERYPEDASLRAIGAESYLGTRITAAGETLGIIALMHDAPLRDSPAARAILTMFARRASAELLRLRAERAEREGAETVLHFRSVLLELAKDETSDLDATVRRLVRAASEAMNVARVSYWSLAPDRSRIECHQLFQTATQDYGGGAVLHAKDFPAYFDALLSSRVIVASNARRDPRTSEFTEAYFEPNGITSMLDVPVWHRGRLAGVLCHEHVGPAREWTSREEDFAVGLAALVAVALEASERRRHEERFELVARVTNDVLYDWNLANDRLELSDGISTRFRYDPATVRQDLEWWGTRIHADDREAVFAKLGKILASDATAYEDEYRFTRGDGTIATVIDRAFIIRDPSGAATRMVGAMIDVTDRRAMEARLLLADRMASVGTLAAGVAHEINNPLAYILANVDHVLDAMKRSGDPRVDLIEALGDAREGATRVKTIVRDLRTFSRSDEEKREPVDLRSVADSTINMALNEVRHRAHLVKDYGEVPLVDANPARLGQVVLNLVVNAAQAIPEGSAEGNEIRLTTRTDRMGRAILEVRDTGPGIPPELRTRVFDPFYTTKPVGVGTGLGLSICHSIVTNLGGEISVEDPGGRGTLMRVTLPPAGRPARRVDGPVAAVAGPRRPSILIIDDDERVLGAIRRTLKAECEVTTATSAREALALLASAPLTDVILCDLMMPDMTGMDFHAELARTAPGQAARVIFMTGGAFTPASQEFLSTVDNPTIDKPIDLAQLRALIRARMT